MPSSEACSWLDLSPFLFTFFFLSFCPCACLVFLSLQSHLHPKKKTEEQRQATSKSAPKTPAAFFFFVFFFTLLRSTMVADEIGSNSFLWCFLVFFSLLLSHLLNKNSAPCSPFSHRVAPLLDNILVSSLCPSLSVSLSAKTSCPAPVKIPPIQAGISRANPIINNAKIATSCYVLCNYERLEPRGNG